MAGTQIFSYTDHEALRPLLTADNVPALFVRWINRVQKFNVLVRHLSGRSFDVDYLSRIRSGYDLPE